MESLNYHHLHYFWMVAREGSVTAAAQRLHLAPSTVSAQVKALEEMLGHAMFRRVGRGLELTDRGRLVKEYADDIFSMGQEMVDVVRSEGGRHATRVRVGVATNLPKLVARRLLQAVLQVDDEPVHLVVHHGDPASLVADLAVHHLDLVLSDALVGLVQDVKAEAIELGASPLLIYGTPELAAAHRDGFPRSLDGAPLILPDVSTPMRRALDECFDSAGLHPRVVGEFDDSALLKAFGEAGLGLFPAPGLVREAICKSYGVEVVGVVPHVEERIFAIAMPTRKENPYVRALVSAAREDLARLKSA